MKTMAQTTYLLMERGVEDVELLKQLEQAIGVLASGPIDAATKYPMIYELVQGLREEINAQNLTGG